MAYKCLCLGNFVIELADVPSTNHSLQSFFNRSLKVTWIKKYLDKENCGSWKRFFDSEKTMEVK